MRQEYRAFKETEDSDYDYYQAERVITGRLTDMRREMIQNWINRMNEDHANPYGVSPNGYAYRCGHEHDCCGCSSGKNFHVEFDSHWKGSKVTIRMTESFNY